MADRSPLLELKGIRKSYPGSGEVLRGIDLQVHRAESLSVVGPSGSGKSTLLNMIGGLDRPDAGHVLLGGRDISALSEAELAQVRARTVGFIFQLHHLLPQCSVLENVLVPTLAVSPREREARREETRSRALRLLARVGLSDRLNHRPGQLSGGERQRAAVVRALINEPKLLLADEPTGSLDQTSADNLARLLVELNHEEGVALIVITHSTQLASLLSRALQLREGRLEPVDRPV